MDDTLRAPDLVSLLERAQLRDMALVVNRLFGDLDEMLHHIAAEANHVKDVEFRDALDELYSRLQEVEESY